MYWLVNMNDEAYYAPDIDYRKIWATNCRKLQGSVQAVISVDNRNYILPYLLFRKPIRYAAITMRRLHNR